MSSPKNILAPASLSLNNYNKPSHDLGSPKTQHHHHGLHHQHQHKQQYQHQQQLQHAHVLGGKSVAGSNKILPFTSSMDEVKYAAGGLIKPGTQGLGSMLSTPLTPSASLIASSVVEADAKQQQLLKDSLTADLKLLLHEFERFQQATAAAAGTGGVGEEEAAERSTKVEFFLGYIERVLHDLAGADASKLQDLEVRIKTSLLPLKGQVVSQLAAQNNNSPPPHKEQQSSWFHPSSTCSSLSSSSSVSSVHTTPPGSPLAREETVMSTYGPFTHSRVAAADAVFLSSSSAASRLMPPVSFRRDQSDISGITSCSSSSSSCGGEGGAGHMDDLDLECFSLIMDEAAATAPFTTAGNGGKDLPANGSCVDDDMTDAGSLTSEESSVFVSSPRESSSSLSTVSTGLDPTSSNSGNKRTLPLEFPSSSSSSSSSSLSLATASSVSTDTLQQPLKRARSVILPTSSSSSSSCATHAPPCLASSSTSTSSSFSSPFSSSSVATVAAADVSKPLLRQVEYQCGACADTYTAASSLNPWWALERQECPKCKKVQVPRIDINLPANTMEYHPALLAEEGDDDDDDEVGGGREGGMMMMPGGGDGHGHVEEREEGETSEKGSGGSSVLEEDEEAVLSPMQASQLLSLLEHARTCPGNHAAEKHQAVCTSAKYLMLHVRDCDGRTLDGEACGFSWCRPCKHLLGHLVRCYEAEKCQICCFSHQEEEEKVEKKVMMSVEEMIEEKGMRVDTYRSLTSLS
ncbi:Hypothetical protein NocV09_00700980 [Nannochloropsis oceanica]